MTDGRDPKVTAAYRELGAEEPPRALDEAILAAARRPRAAFSRTWAQRYAAPLGLAAVLVLSVTVTLRMQYEQPGIEQPTVAQKQSAPVAEAPLRLKSEEQIKSAAEAQARPRAATRKEQAEPKPFADQARAAPAAPAAAPPASADMAASRADASRGMESSVTGEIVRQREERTARDAEAASRAHQVGPLQALAKRNEPAVEAKTAVAGAAAAPAAKPAPAAERAAEPAPEQELERISALRREGRHEDADKALAEFRQRYPDYKISDAMRERVERR